MTGRLELPTVTLLSFAPNKAIKAAIYALVWSMRLVDFGAVVIVTERGSITPRSVGDVAISTMRKSGVKIIEVEGVPASRTDGYEVYHIRNLPKWFKTPHVLFQEWDAGVVNPTEWNPEWLETDFIGAPWPYPYQEPNYPACTVENCVGNGGFSLRSRRFCEASIDVMNQVPVPSPLLSDCFLARTCRPFLEQQGIVFGTYQQAQRFSCENRIYSGEFGMHGKGTMALNNWNRDTLILI